MKYIIDQVRLLILAIALDVAIVITIGVVYVEYFSEEAQHRRIHEIYRKLVVSSGESDRIPPLIISNNEEVNAYTNGEIIVLHQGIIDITKSDDEIALIIGHEIAHNTLGHLDGEKNKEMTREGEAMADRVGAYYMMKAGYNLCKGREVWKAMREKNGESLNGSHPDVSYRLSQLNINCKGE